MPERTLLNAVNWMKKYEKLLIKRSTMKRVVAYNLTFVMQTNKMKTF